MQSEIGSDEGMARVRPVLLAGFLSLPSVIAVASLTARSAIKDPAILDGLLLAGSGSPLFSASLLAFSIYVTLRRRVTWRGLSLDNGWVLWFITIGAAVAALGWIGRFISL